MLDVPRYATVYVRWQRSPHFSARRRTHVKVSSCARPTLRGSGEWIDKERTVLKFTALTLAACAVSIAGAGADAAQPQRLAPMRHVLLISVDGLHQADLANWIAHNPTSALAQLSASGVTYTAARTTTPSDSFPGLLAMVTGGTPKSTGVYYDDSYDRTLYAPGSNCSGNPGIETVFDESIDVDSNQLFSGGIDPAYLPLQKLASGACVPVYPHDFVKVNTVFEVVRWFGGYTAWADKHAAYDLVNGPSGRGVVDLYTPEVNSLIANGGTANGVDLAATKALCDGTNSLPLAKVSDYTTCIPAIEAYDDTKVRAILNQIDGLRADGSAAARVPNLFGMNFQAVSVGQKLPIGGYVDAAATPSANLAHALAHTDASLGRIVAELDARGLRDSTLIIVSAKHGQSPTDKSTLAMESGGRGDTSVQDPSGFIAAADASVDTPSSFTNPNSGSTLSTGGHLQTDDVGMVWLQNQSASNIASVLAQLQANRAAMHADALPPGTVLSASVEAGHALAKLFGDPTSSAYFDRVSAARAPNVLIQPNAGTIYSGSSKKIAEHGGGTVDDTNVALLLSQSRLAARSVSTPVSTTQIAPTILRALRLPPELLEAVREERTRVLPEIIN